MSYSFGFSWIGLLAVLLPMLPNLFYFRYPHVAIPAGNPVHPLLKALEHGSRGLFLAFLVCIVPVSRTLSPDVWAAGAAVMLLSYLAFWALLFAGRRSPRIYMGLAVFPVLYFMFAELWLGHLLALVPTAVFAGLHLYRSYQDFAA